MNSVIDVVALDPNRLRVPSQVRTLQLGDVNFGYVSDGWLQLNPRLWFAASTPGYWAAHREYLDDAGYLPAGMGGLLVERDGRALLIDAGFGPGEVPANPDRPRLGAIFGGRLLDNLALLGRAPVDVEALAFTHLHLDHIGWASAPAPRTGRFPFAHARAIVAKAEWEHGVSEEHGPFPETVAALEPHLELVVDRQEVFPGVKVLSTPGHSAGHTAYEITAGTETLIAFGDLFHSPVQMENPGWAAQPDVDGESSTRHRRALLERLAAPGTYGFGIHFADVAFGRVVRDDDRFAWQPVETGVR
jgi:glyoxylase-like metal-dependent hydrolase (beta-lactamase superfamily II)